jgi:hypothetical protein
MNSLAERFGPLHYSHYLLHPQRGQFACASKPGFPSTCM